MWGDEFTPSLSVSEPKINAEEGDIVNDDKGYSDPKEECISDLISSYEIPNEVEDKPPPARCELGKLREKNLVQREEHISEYWTLLQHDEVEITRNEVIYSFCIDHMSSQPSYIPSTSHHGRDFA